MRFFIVVSSLFCGYDTDFWTIKLDKMTMLCRLEQNWKKSGPWFEILNQKPVLFTRTSTPRPRTWLSRPMTSKLSSRTRPRTNNSGIV